MIKQYGFSYDEGRCIRCRTCEVACQSTRHVEPWLKWRRVVETWSGKFPDVTCTFFSLACMHCGYPACVAVCPTGAISKRTEDGIVVVDKSKCNGCRECLSACPYDVPKFDQDGIMQKCDFCVDRVGEPACVVSCPAEALHYGTLDELLAMAAGKTIRRMDGPTEPSVIIIR